MKLYELSLLFFLPFLGFWMGQPQPKPQTVVVDQAKVVQAAPKAEPSPRIMSTREFLDALAKLEKLKQELSKSFQAQVRYEALRKERLELQKRAEQKADAKSGKKGE